MEEKIKINKNLILTFISLVVTFVIGWLIYYFSVAGGYEPSGNDVWAHIYKTQIMYENLNKGILYPLYADDWYNGIQLYRYWPPLAYYIMAGLQFVTSGNVIHAYYAFCAFIFVSGAIPFVLIGYKLKRPCVGFVTGILFFVMPDNYRVIIYEGNAARMITSVITVYVMFFLWEYMTNNNRRALIGLALSMMLMTFGHLMITAMIGVGAFVYLLFDSRRKKQTKKMFVAVGTMLSGILMAGIWMVPATMGGMVAASGGEVSEQPMWSQTVWKSLNIMNRIAKVPDEYYFGLSIMFVAVFGIVLARGRKKAGFYMTVAILLIISPAFLSIIVHLPLGRMFWMSRYSALAYACLLMAFLEWKTIKQKYAMICISLLILDCVIGVFCTNAYYEVTVGSEAAHVESDILKENTVQRACNMDRSKFGSYPAWNLVSGEGATKYSYGWAWQGASTADNIMSMNEALEMEQYEYVFDRSIELGDDTILVKKYADINETKLKDVASSMGYEQIHESKDGIIFKKNTPNQFGVKTRYEGLAIGKYTTMFTEFFPLFEKGASDYIDTYSVEELTKYTTIYLSGFEYNDKQMAENVLKEVSENGTRVVLDISHLPGNALKQPYFMGINAYSISYDNTFPALHYGEQIIVPSRFAEADRNWKASYSNNYDTVLGYVMEGEHEIPFMGYDSSNKNIYYIGLNMIYYAQYTDRDDIWALLEDAFLLKQGATPVRELVPIKIEVGDNYIHVHSDEDDVNTTLAFQDNFVSNKSIYAKNNMLYVNSGDTLINLVYPHLGISAFVSLIGFISCIGCWKISKKYSD